MLSFINFGLLAALLQIVSAAPTPQLQHRDVPCAPVHVVYARGSGEGYDYNRIKDVIVPQLRDAYPGANFLDLGYPASDINVVGPDGYAQSVQKGVDNLRAHLNKYQENCPASNKIVLLGYSQGATVTLNCLLGDETPDNPLRQGIRDMIHAVTVFGDPDHVPQVNGVPGWEAGTGSDGTGLAGPRQNYQDVAQYYHGKVRSYCTDGDTVCDAPGYNDSHLTEIDDHNAEAVAFIESKL